MTTVFELMQIDYADEPSSNGSDFNSAFIDAMDAAKKGWELKAIIPETKWGFGHIVMQRPKPDTEVRIPLFRIDLSEDKS